METREKTAKLSRGLSIAEDGPTLRESRACLNVSQKARPRSARQFVPSFAQSPTGLENARIKEKLKLCRRSYYRPEPP